MVCSLLHGIELFCDIALPYKIELTKLGYQIEDFGRRPYPLYLVNKMPELGPSLAQPTVAQIKDKVKLQIEFEMGLALLDANLQYILFNSSH